MSKCYDLVDYGRALRAIVARVDGDFDNLDLMGYGPLTNTLDDVKRIAMMTLGEWEHDEIANPPDVD